MQQILEKRLFDNRYFDVDCSDLLDDDEQIIGGVSVLIDNDDGSLSLGGARVNPAPIFYSKLNRTAQIGKAVQMRISGGIVVLAGTTERIYTLRLRFSTNINMGIEATVQLRLTDQP